MSGMADWQAKISIDIDDLKKRIKVAEGELDKVTKEDRKVKLDIDTKTLESAIQKLDKMLDSLGKGTGDFKQFENLSKELSAITSEVQSFSKAFGKVDDSGTKTLLSSIQNIDRSLSDLSQHILNVNKNMGNISGNTNGAVKQVENIGNAAAEAAKQVDKLAEAQDKLGGNKTNISLGDSSTATSNADAEIKANSEVITSIEKKKQELASYELQLEETRYEIEKLSKAEAKTSIIDNNYSEKQASLLRDNITKRVLGKYDPTLGKDGSKKWMALDNLANIDANTLKSYQMWQEELQKVGYTLSEIRETSVGLEADIIPIDGKAITNAEEFRKALDSISVSPSENVKLLNQQISELESKISSLKSEISSLESVSNNPMKDAFPNNDNVVTSSDSVTNAIKEENNALEQNTQKAKENADVKEKLANADKEVSNVNLSKYDKRIDGYDKKLTSYQATASKFKDGGWTSDTYTQNIDKLNTAITNYKNLTTEVQNKGIASDEEIDRLNQYESEIKQVISTVSNMSATEKGFTFLSGQKELDKINKILNENSAMSQEAKNQIKAYYEQIKSGNPSASLDVIHGKIMEIVNAEADAGRTGKSLFDIFSTNRLHQIVAQAAGMFSFYDVINVGKQGLQSIRELNTALTEMRKVSDETVQSLKNYQSTTFDTANAVGTTAKQIQNSTADYMRLGESLEEASESAKTANILLNVSEFDNIEDATKSLVSMGQAYKDLDKLTIVDKLNEVGRRLLPKHTVMYGVI